MAALPPLLFGTPSAPHGQEAEIRTSSSTATTASTLDNRGLSVVELVYDPITRFNRLGPDRKALCCMQKIICGGIPPTLGEFVLSYCFNKIQHAPSLLRNLRILALKMSSFIITSVLQLAAPHGAFRCGHDR